MTSIGEDPYLVITFNIFYIRKEVLTKIVIKIFFNNLNDLNILYVLIYYQLMEILQWNLIHISTGLEYTQPYSI